jgi:hypothetical protein
MAAFMPGESPPDVKTAIFFMKKSTIRVNPAMNVAIASSRECKA